MIRKLSLLGVGLPLLVAIPGSAMACSEATLSRLLDAGFTAQQILQTLTLTCAGQVRGATAVPQASPKQVEDASAVPKTEPTTAAWGAKSEIKRPEPKAAATPAEGGGPLTLTSSTSSSTKGGAPEATAFWKGWGVGLALLRNKSKVVNEASIVNGVVRASNSQHWQPQIILAKHLYFHHSDNRACLWTKIGCPGVFVGVGLGGTGGNQIIDMIGGGFILGFGSATDNSSNDQAHNIGIGIGRRFGVKLLGDGLKVDAVIPPGETQIRYKSIDITAPFLFYTYKFD